MEAKTSTANLGAVASVRGSVVDVRFDGPLPPIYSVLRSGAKNEIVIEVPRDLVNLTPVELRHYLAEHHVLPLELARSAG